MIQSALVNQLLPVPATAWTGGVTDPPPCQIIISVVLKAEW